jgi:hypothetical protein
MCMSIYIHLKKAEKIHKNCLKSPTHIHMLWCTTYYPMVSNFLWTSQQFGKNVPVATRLESFSPAYWRVTRFDRIFDHRAIICFGQFFENYKWAQIFGPLFSVGKAKHFFDKNRLGQLLGRFFNKFFWSPCVQPKKNQFRCSSKEEKNPAITQTRSRKKTCCSILFASSRSGWRDEFANKSSKKLPKPSSRQN